MINHFHNWSRWLDTDQREEAKFLPLSPFPFYREVIVQQKRCSICNIVKTRRA